ncbi:hypothetical protein [Acidisphaera rubrifaciens]|uniref:Uncharacterized protein n=1 Tax=Acidisphaera rubrifaciens HS-AP3 TaxID=1231350 RepID=A0A0D6P290_9PROT|nr:hypothetical protein [Acidisphaera rubrifaciens]GAN75875.1 hypothetical protein Asru_0012_01 [Acidisphaera rubrifaciens HS-AP3]
MGDTFIISGLREKRSSIAGRIMELRREAERLEADLFHIDAVLRLYDVEPADIPTKGRVPVRSSYFGRNEITRRIYDALRTQGAICAVDIAAQAMRDKGLDPAADRKLRTNFAQRFLTSLHDLRKAGRIERIGNGKGVRWRLVATVDDAATGG